MTENNFTYVPLAEPIPISEQKWPEGTTPLVSTSTLTYNHNPYIRDCLDGILMQKTTFPVRVVVFDDCSTDGTREIVKEYKEKYPSLIVAVLPGENTWNKPEERKEAMKPRNEARNVAKYIALCEGDDYWTDPLKLQKQVDFLEANPEYSMCFTNAEVLYDGIVAPKSGTSIYNHLQSKEYSGTDVLKKWTVPTASVVFRNYFNEGKVMPWDNRFLFGDIVLFLWLAEFGKLWCINEKTVVYRRNSKVYPSLKM